MTKAESLRGRAAPEASGLPDAVFVGSYPDPTTPLTFTYRCAVHTVFPAKPANVVGLELIPEVLRLQLSPVTERKLVAKLEHALAQIQSGDESKAVHSLDVFIHQVDLMSGRKIDETDAADLIASAEEAIELIALGKTPREATGR